MNVRNSLNAGIVSSMLEKLNTSQSQRNSQNESHSMRNLMDVFTRSTANTSPPTGYSHLQNRGTNSPGSSQGIHWDADGRPWMLDAQGQRIGDGTVAEPTASVQHEPVSQDLIKWRLFYQNQVNYANTFLFGRDGGEPIGQTAFQRFLTENNIELPEGARFDISVDGYGRVTISGLEDAELTARIENAMSYDFQFIRSTLVMFREAVLTIENNATDGGMGLSRDQHWKMQINSMLMNDYGIGLRDLSLDENGIIQGLPEELANRIYGDRTGMSQIENDFLDHLRDTIGRFLREGTDSIPVFDVNLTFENGRIVVN